MSRFHSIKKCCKPSGSKKCSKILRIAQNWMFEKCPSVRQGDYVCDSCRQDLIKKPTVEILYEESMQEANDETYRSSEVVFEELNEFLKKIDESPVSKKKLQTQRYAVSKYRTIESLIKTHVFPTLPPEENSTATIVEGLKAKFVSSTDRKERTTILTLAPKTWPTSKVLKEFEGFFLRKKKFELLLTTFFRLN